METFSRSLFPNWWRSPLNEPKIEVEYQHDWLEREVDEYKIKLLPPVIHDLRGWRKKEVIKFIVEGKDWTAGIFR